VGEISINGLAERVLKITNSKSTIEHVPYETVYPIGFEDMQRRVPNIEKIQKLTGWKPERNLSDIVSDTEKYLRK
jgi:UDP-glucose 4-epimerase